jgi:hypothetical protein
VGLLRRSALRFLEKSLDFSLFEDSIGHAPTPG